MNPKTDVEHPKPRFALAIATGLGLGYLPKAPGTFGSLLGVLLNLLAWAAFTMEWDAGRRWDPRTVTTTLTVHMTAFLAVAWGLAILISAVGVWAADRAATYLHKKDPQIVVVDEVAGQLITYLGLATTATFALNWQYLLAGFILFRVFDIWKPFPIRRAESLPGGLGIMADDWIAGLYAALVLALARHFGF